MKLADGLQYNLHCHTQFCDGRTTMARFVDDALALGYHTLGFSPHGPTCVESSCNMKREDVSVYFEEIDRLRAITDGKLQILAGMEIDYINPDCGPHSDYYQTLPLDYRIGSVHFIPNQDGEPIDVDGRFSRFKESMARYFRNDIEYVVSTYFRQLRQMIDYGGFDILGHMDKIARNATLFAPGIEDSELYKEEVAKAIRVIDTSKCLVEINTKIFDTTGRTFPNRRYWLTLANRGNSFCVNSDSHEAAKLNSGRNAVVQEFFSKNLPKNLHMSEKLTTFAQQFRGIAPRRGG